ncbi:MAG: NAD(P)H-hydrate dehydratase [Candidatus Binataceae bacterium]
MILLNASESRELDRLSRQKYGVASYALMTRAGAAVANAVALRWPAAFGRGVLVIAGKGNNGGDGFTAARRLLDLGGAVRVILLARMNDLKGDAARACADFVAKGGLVNECDRAEWVNTLIHGAPHEVIIDAIFGTGLNALVRDPGAAAIATINQLGAPVVAVDIPSGINSDTGAVMGAAVRATLTVTFGLAKYGHASYPGAEYCGELEIARIGFAPRALEEIAPRGRLIDAAEGSSMLRPRARNTHKGTYGHALIIAGGSGKSGAAVLTSRGALRTGAGLVTAAIPESVAAIVAAGPPELMTEPLPERDGHFAADGSIQRLTQLVEGKSALVTGPGMGVSKDVQRLLTWLIEHGAASERALLIDADGLNSLALLGPAQLRAAHGAVVLTPHPGEMARLLGTSVKQVNQDRISAARRLADLTGAEVLLKGARTVIAAGNEVHINASGNPGMATAGMGDSLSGIIGALLAQGYPPPEAVRLGVFLHGYAADRVAERIGAVGFLAGDVIEEIPAAITSLLAVRAGPRRDPYESAL